MFKTKINSMSLLVKIAYLAGVLVAFASAKPLTEEEMNARVSEIIAKCQAQEGATDSDIQNTIAHLAPTTRTGKCFNACFMETVGIMKDGKFVAEGSIKIAEMSGDPTKIKNAEVVGKECQSVGGDDRCDSVLEIRQCVHQAAAKLGIDPTKDLH